MDEMSVALDADGGTPTTGKLKIPSTAATTTVVTTGAQNPSLSQDPSPSQDLSPSPSTSTGKSTTQTLKDNAVESGAMQDNRDRHAKDAETYELPPWLRSSIPIGTKEDYENRSA